MNCTSASEDNTNLGLSGPPRRQSGSRPTQGPADQACACLGRCSWSVWEGGSECAAEAPSCAGHTSTQMGFRDFRFCQNSVQSENASSRRPRLASGLSSCEPCRLLFSLPLRSACMHGQQCLARSCRLHTWLADNREGDIGLERD